MTNMSVRMRLAMIMAGVVVLFSVLIFAFLSNSSSLKSHTIKNTTAVMMEGQKAKLKVASHSIAVSLGDLISGEADPAGKIELIRNAIDGVRFETDESGYYFVYEDTTCVAQPTKKSLQGEDLRDLKDQNGVYFVKEMRDKAGRGGGFVRYIWPKPGSGDQPKLSYAEMIPGTRYWIGTGVYLDNIQLANDKLVDDIDTVVRQKAIYFLGIGSVVFLVILVLCILISRSVVGALRKVEERITDIAEGEGDLTQRIDIDTRDEIGRVASGVDTFIEKLHRLLGEVIRKSFQLAASANELFSVSQAMTDGTENLSGMATTVAAAAEEMSVNMNTVAAASEEASTNVDLIAASVSEMTSTVNEIAQNSERARTITGEAVSKAENASERVNDLGGAAREISKVTEVITEISEQTNLLALNATIEAARAGEAGKGFAVVANEIKELAGQTANATQDIKQKIEGIQKSTEGTVSEISQISAVINDVNDIVASIATAVEEQSATTAEIAENVNQASIGIREINENVAQSSSVAEEVAQNISQVSAVTDEIVGSSAQVNSNSELLSTAAGSMKDLMSGFKVADEVYSQIPGAGTRTAAPLLKWGSRLQFDIQAIDEQHKKLVGLINDLHQAMTSGQGQQQLLAIVAELVAYTGYHFREEESLMRQHGYEGLAQQEAQHKSFVDKVKAFQKDFENGKVMMSMDLMEFLKDWLVSHILKSDKKYVPWFRQKGVD